MIRQMDDRYIRAILIRVAGEEWEEILDDAVLPLLDRIALAVWNLDDRDVSRPIDLCQFVDSQHN